MKKFLSYTFVFLIILLSSCEIQKRNYRSGFYVSGKNKQAVTQKSVITAMPPQKDMPALSASAENFSPQIKTKTFKIIELPPDSCDFIFFKDGTQIKGKIVDLTNKEIQYHYCDFEDKKLHISSRLLLVRIEYANGVIEDFENGVSVKIQPGKTPQMTDAPQPTISVPSPTIDTTVLHTPEVKSIPNTTLACERIMFRDGNEAYVKLIEITPDEVKYKMCDMQTGPVFVKLKSDIFMIVHQNGTKEIFNKTVVSKPFEPYAAKSVKPKNGLAITGFIFSLLGFYPLIGIGSLVGLILGIIYMNKHRLNPEVYDHPKLAQTAIILSAIVLAIIAAALVISLL